MKNKELKEIIKKSITGFPVGVLVLMIAYICIYFVAGATDFENEINQLKNVNTLIAQILVSGISWVIIFIEFKIIKLAEKYDYNNIENANKENYNKSITKVLILGSISAIVSIGIFFWLNDMSIFSKNLADMKTIIFAIIFVLTGFTNAIIDTINKFVINKKLKEINKE